ncbi:MAG: PCP reductase family protein [Candidatus Dormibacteria bacterium]
MTDANAAPGGCPVPRDTGGEAAASSACPVPAEVRGEERPPAHPRWTEAARQEAASAARRAGGSHLDAERAAAMADRVVEARAERSGLEEVSDLFVRTLGKKLGYGHPLSERTEETSAFTWTPEAEARLAEVPSFCRELTRWRVEWTARKLGLGTTITPREMEVKFEMWGAVSHAIEGREREALPWTESARSRFDRVPEFVRGQVLEAVEGNARRLQLSEVNDAVVDLVVAHWQETGDFHEGMYGFR